MLMRLTSFFLGLCLVIGSATAQEENNTRTAVPLLSVLWCDEPSKMLDLVESKYDEQPMMLGSASVQESTTGKFLNFVMTFYFNKETESWSIIGVIPEIENSKACMLLNGKGLQPYVRGPAL